jgi:hypothetical protein
MFGKNYKNRKNNLSYDNIKRMNIEYFNNFKELHTSKDVG